MGYGLWFGIVIALFVIMHYFTELNGRQKGVISLIAAVLIAGAIAYNIQSDREREQVSAIELKYQRGETVVCQGAEINSTTFSYSVGTQSFVGNKGTPHFQQIYNVRECE